MREAAIRQMVEIMVAANRQIAGQNEWRARLIAARAAEECERIIFVATRLKGTK